MGDIIAPRKRNPRPLAPHSRMRIERLKSDIEAFELTARVAGEREISLRELLRSDQSSGHVRLSRQMAMYLVHVLLRRPQERVAFLFCRGHTTVSYACRRVELLRDDPAFEAEIQRIEAEGWGQRHAA